MQKISKHRQGKIKLNYHLAFYTSKGAFYGLNGITGAFHDQFFIAPSLATLASCDHL